MDEDTLDVFFHEYIHYIQDVTTISGYQNLYAFNEYIRYAVNWIYNQSSKQFQVPITVGISSDNVAANINVREITNGDAETVFCFDIKRVTTNHKATHPINDIREVILESRSGKKRRFGAIAIKESMAYLFEKTCGKQIKSDDYPYDIVRRLVMRYSAAIANDPVKLIALCDMCLLCSNPAGMMLTFLKKLKKGEIKINEAEDIVNWFYFQLYESWDGKRVSLLDSFRELHLQTLNSITSYIKIPVLEKEINGYFRNLMAAALDLRQWDPYFMIRMAREGYCLTNPTFHQLVGTLGYPMLKNLNDHHFLYRNPLGDASILQYFSAIAEIIKLFMTGQNTCEMYKWCKESPQSTPNYHCNVSPWKKTSDTNLCPYALLWKHWNLATHSPILPSPATEDEEYDECDTFLTKDWY